MNDDKLFQWLASVKGDPLAFVMGAFPWGRRVFATAEARGCFADPNGCNFYAQDLVSLGVPVCR